MKALVGAFNQEKALVGAFSVIVKTGCGTDGSFYSTNIGSNGRVRYSIRRDPLDNYKTFAIDPESGLITLQRPLDRERQKIYELRVEATDEGQTCNLCLTEAIQVSSTIYDPCTTD